MIKPTLQYARRNRRAEVDAPPLSITARIFCGLGGVAIPILCFGLTFERSSIAPDCRTNGEENFTSFLFGGPAAYPFYPLLALAMVAMSLIIISPTVNVRRLPVRLGIYSGMLLALQYCVVETVAGSSNMPLWLIALIATFFLVPLEICFCIIAFGVSWLMVTAVRHVVPRSWWPLIFCAGAALLLFLETKLGIAAMRQLASALAIFLLLAPQVAFLAFGYIAIFVSSYVGDDGDLPIQTLPLTVTWLAGYLVAWRMAIATAAAQFAALPIRSNTGCYVCTAAAKGHPWLVGAERPRHPDGTAITVNNQIRRLKCAEIALQAIWPAGHRRLRRVYDWLGPLLARRLRHPLLGDIAFISIFPFEWLAVGVMMVLGLKPLELARQMYRECGAGRTLAVRSPGGFARLPS